MINGSGKKKILIPLVGMGIIAALVLILAAVTTTGGNNNISDEESVTYIPKRVLTLETGDLKAYAETPFICGEPLDKIKQKAPFEILTPTVLPEGYSLRGADYSGADVILRYADANVCGEGAIGLRDGVLEIVVVPLSRLEYNNGSEFVQDRLNSYKRTNLEANTYLFTNGNHAIGYPVGIGTSKTIDENDRVIYQENFDYPASVMMVDEKTKTAYSLRAFIPLEDLVRIAESIK